MSASLGSLTTNSRRKPRPENLAERIYLQLKAEIFDFRLLPGDRFCEMDVAERMAASRTPVREALYRLQRDGYVEVHFRSGWQVKPFDFRMFEELYDVRVILECAAVRRLCEGEQQSAQLEELKREWLVPDSERTSDSQLLSVMDERFHTLLVAASGNREMALMHAQVSERIRIIRRLDFTQQARIQATYDEHARILRAILKRRSDDALLLLKSHIEASKAEVRKITLHMLHAARSPLTGNEGAA